jgi:hypothetical protein
MTNMKSRIILSLIGLLFLSSGQVHARKADIRIIDSHIYFAGDSVHVWLVLKAIELSSNYRMDLTPAIRKGTKEVLLPVVRIAGNRNRRSQERRELLSHTAPNDAPLTIQASDTLFYEATLPYEPWMNHASLRVDNRLSGCCSSVMLSPVLVTGDLALVIPQPEPEAPVVVPVPVPVLSPTKLLAQEEGFVRPAEMYEADKQTANYYCDPNALRVFFRQGHAEMDTVFRDNTATLNRLSRVLRVMTQDSTIHITRLVIVGYASIEGSLQHNIYLAGKRANALREYTIARGVPESSVEIINMGEGWDELRDMVARRDNVPYREEVLRIIDTVPVLNGREKRLMELRGGVPYRWMLKNLFPNQRNAGYVKIYFEDN